VTVPGNQAKHGIDLSTALGKTLVTAPAAVSRQARRLTAVELTIVH
jgi:hypothetical protein